ncbi:phage baseplate protein [Aquimarina brevivitae]|uniref:Microcystin-dependent protein n=1 Tax=Aquimarina brevivitae TaxID=323412 RepID=A0A4Q7P0S6_9FLAO|nr:hypothetical protein [Aquimarina brevivitae]RZS93401.1 microcystin-dependent protein [Aquimarina brevivitae]
MTNSKITPPPPIQPTIPVGTIFAFSGNTADIPSGWVLCNEEGIKSLPQDKKSKVPNLDGRTLIGQGSTYQYGTTGGQPTHTLTTDELPSHTHSINNGGFGTLGIGLEPDNDSNYIPFCSTGYVSSISPANTGSNKSHNNMQPYYVAYYIMYIGLHTESGFYSNS